MTTEDRRRSVRFVFLLDVDCSAAEAPLRFKAQMVDVSRHGVKLRLGEEGLQPGSPLEMKVWLPSQNTPVVLRGSVIRREGTGHDWIFGVALDRTPENAAGKDQILGKAYRLWKDKKTPQR
jgi:hypothetical protein